jgi:hypothetical protein
LVGAKDGHWTTRYLLSEQNALAATHETFSGGSQNGVLGDVKKRKRPPAIPSLPTA